MGHRALRIFPSRIPRPERTRGSGIARGMRISRPGRCRTRIGRITGGMRISGSMLGRMRIARTRIGMMRIDGTGIGLMRIDRTRIGGARMRITRMKFGTRIGRCIRPMAIHRSSGSGSGRTC